LKPETETGAQLIVQGRRVATVKARDYAALKPTLMPAVLDSFRRLAAEADLVLVEGAGSPAEVNLREGDIANMGFAEAADLAVVLVADIHRGGVIASLVGTHAVLEPAEAARVRGFIVNRFRGDPDLFADGVRFVERRTGWPCFGIVPDWPDAAKLPAEDAASLADAARAATSGGVIRIAVPMLSRIANFDDLDPLRLEPDVAVDVVPPGRALPVADLLLLPGSKSTLGDLAFLRTQGWAIDIAAHVRRGGHVLGLCAGYQMLGRFLSDHGGIDGPAGAVAGLGLLDVETVMTPDKRLLPVAGRHLASGATVAGYEMHVGRTDGPDCARPLLDLDGRPDGAVSPDGLVAGCHVHGLFAADGFRHAFLSGLRAGRVPGMAYEATIDATLDGLADHLERYLDVGALIGVMSGLARQV
jgi:adenosylcobyric acid synthase